uniref:histone-lysine N-methyltransferase NSD2 n=1 Tax=Doryrhamphus excisus TaxID=161450 RepID=UPI0025AEA42E|nr:histone-lysine N-methyltransferase NSD2 [Doryrhamphus excisus]XP_057933795.1 histone-lysine N-methyltransferase NSD2 [Doryrhamphus excisus]XP_057933796.1 histone-lysine N-methyltransferase NSD2 [Doryrhamphus excisus]
MDSKGSSLPSMPEPANPISMKQPPESLAMHKARGDMSGDPSLLMNQAAAQLATTLQDGVLQKISNHSHETLKDLTSRVLNGEQDDIPKLCAAEAPILKGAEAPPSNGTHPHTCSPHSESELKVTIPQVVGVPLFEPCSAGGTSLSTSVEGTASAPQQSQEVKRRRGRPHKPKPQPRLGSSNIFEETLGSDPVLAAADEPAVVSPEASHKQRSFSVGDVVWTKVSGYPWWPCIVTIDPEFNHHFKHKLNAKSRSGLLYHVQYFGDAPERGYIFEKNMVSFAGEDQYQELSLRNKQPVSRIIHKKTLQSVPRKLRPQWKMGVIQATEALVMTLDDRLANFTFVYDDNGPHLNPCILDKLKPEPSMEAETRLLLGSLARLTAASRDNTLAGTNMTTAKQGEWLDGLQTLSQVHMAVGSVVPLKKQQRPKQLRSPLKTDKRSKPAQKMKLNNGSLAVKRGWKQKRTNVLDVDKGQQSKRRRKNSQASMSEGDDEKPKRRRRKINKEIKETTEGLKKSKGLADDREAEKPKRHRKRKQNGENFGEPSKTKRRRLSLDPEPEGSGSEGCPDSPSDSLDGMKKGERKKEFVCQVCEEAGEHLVPCEGQCCGMFHLRCLSESFKADDKLLCQQCSTGVHPCFTCKRSDGEVRRCHVAHCGKYYHEVCARLSPLTVFDNKGFRCPLHTCLSCHYGCRTQHKSTKGRLMRCLRCPVAYHVGDLCIAAGSETVTNTAIICTNHFNAKKGYSHHSHVNVSWCFVCSKGGQLLCCESCPAAFHPDCLNIAMPDGSWFCNDCRAGKKPKYRDIIWVKLGTYRWWPAEIHHPRNIPTNIQHLRHEIGEFPVFFFGSKDYFWTHQGRVFPYMEGDRGSKYQRTGIGKVFKTALMEAEARFKEIKMKQEAKEAQEKNRKPPPYKFIKVNKPVGKVQVYTADIAEIPKCNCKPSVDRPCGFESECLNRMLQYECHPQVCPSGGRCCNQDFTQRLYPETKIIKTPGKGWGLISLRDIKKGEFVNEYIGELIDEDECRARIKYAHENNITDFYMLTIDKDRIIDAGPKGNFSRFMNHSCQPNCETQKWTVNGDTRVGLFAVCDIPSGTELTFNYNLDCLGNEKTVCRCGAPNCSGFLGDRPKNSNGTAAEPKGKRLKRKYRKRRTEGKKSDDECFRCGDGGQLVICGKKTCTKAFHLSCLNLSKRPFGRWDCPWHHCDVCGKNSDAFCQLCPNSFCKAHQEGALRLFPQTGHMCCLEHDEQEARLKLDQATAIATPTVGRPKGSKKANGGEVKGKGSKSKAAEA